MRIEIYIFFFVIIRKCKPQLTRNEELRTEITSFRPTWDNGATLLPLDAINRPSMRSGLSATDETPKEDRAGV